MSVLFKKYRLDRSEKFEEFLQANGKKWRRLYAVICHLRVKSEMTLKRVVKFNKQLWIHQAEFFKHGLTAVMWTKIFILKVLITSDEKWQTISSQQCNW